VVIHRAAREVADELLWEEKMIRITFELEDREEAQKYLQALDALSAIEEFDQWLRGQIKYADREELREVREMLHENLSARGVQLWT
jgi:hypothetical protein